MNIIFIHNFSIIIHFFENEHSRFEQVDFEKLCQETSELFPKEQNPDKFYTHFYVLKDGGSKKRINAKGPYYRAYLNFRDWLKCFGLLVHSKPIKFVCKDGRKSKYCIAKILVIGRKLKKKTMLSFIYRF